MSRIAANVSRLIGRTRPTVGLRTCLAALALVSVGAWFYSPATPSPLPPRSQVERVTVFNVIGVEGPYVGHMRAELPGPNVDRLYAALGKATLTNDDLPDPENVVLAMELIVRTERDSRYVQILASRERGSRIMAYNTDNGRVHGIFRMKADPEAFDALYAVGEAAEDIHRRSQHVSN